MKFLALSFAILCFVEQSIQLDPNDLHVSKPVGNCPNEDTPYPTYLPDNTDPHIFYECSHGVPIKLVCQANLCFDTTVNVCNVCENSRHTFTKPVGKCPAEDGQFPKYLPDKKNPHIFYECSHGKPIKLACNRHLCFNPVLNVCDRCDNFASSILENIQKPVGQCPAVDGPYPVYLPDDQNRHIFYECSHGRPLEVACIDNLCFDPNLSVCTKCDSSFVRKFEKPVGQCPAEDGPYPVYLPDDQNRHIFYECSHGKPLKVACPDNLCFDSILSVCSRCDNSFLSKLAKPVGQCPTVDGPYPVYLPDDQNRHIFYECSHGRPLEVACKDNLCFDPNLSVCTKCDNSFLGKLLKPVGKCPTEDGQFPKYLPDKKNPHIFYECSHGKPIRLACSRHLCFDPVLNVCDKCENSVPGEIENIQKPVGQCPTVDGPYPVYLPDDQNRHIFYECSHGRPLQVACDDNLCFDPNLSVCTKCDNYFLRKLAKPVGQCPAEDGPYPVYLPDDQNRHIFYECSHGKPLKEACPDNLCFDRLLSVCNRCENSFLGKLAKPVGQCPAQDGPYPVYLPDDQNRHIFYECSHGRPLKVACEENLCFDPEINVCATCDSKSAYLSAEFTSSEEYKIASPVGKCPSDDGPYPTYLPDDEDRHTFYECNDGEAIKMECRSNLCFNPNLNVCSVC